MSDNELNQDNVVQFPQTTASEEAKVIDINSKARPIVSAEQIAEKAAGSQEFVMKLIDKNLKKGIEQVHHKLEQLSERALILDPEVESAMRDTQGAVQGLLTWAEASNSLINFIKHDLISMITNIQQQGAQGWQTAAHLQTLIVTLKEKGVISEEELKITWDKLVVPQAKSQIAEQGVQLTTSPEQAQ